MGRMGDVARERHDEDQFLDAEYDEWLSSLADMEAERHGKYPHDDHWHTAPQQQAAGAPLLYGAPPLDGRPVPMVEYANKLLADCSWPASGGPQTSTEDFTPSEIADDRAWMDLVPEEGHGDG